jgi:biotin operon repressor
MQDRKPEVRLSWKEAQRLTILEEVRSGARTQVSAGKALGVTDQWIRKLIHRLEQEGAAGLAHRNRGRVSAQRIPDAVRQQVIQLYRDKYEGFNLTHFREMLLEQEAVKAPCREVLRRVLMGVGVWQRRRAAPKHRLRRPRREHEGELLQLDASIHRWLGEDQGAIALVGAVDDATGDVPDAQFFPAETTQAYLSLLRGILRKRGVPQALYTDRDSVFVVNNAHEVEMLRAQGREPQTQFGRALKELGIEWIPAYSPQAKGRIERLWGTFQDRLLHELRVQKIRTLGEANGYLQKNFLRRYNRRFRVSAAKEPGVYRPAPLWGVLEGILCWKESRILARDHTFSLEGNLWQVLPHEGISALTGRRVEIRRPLSGPLQAWWGAIRLAIRPAARTQPLPALAAAEPAYPVRGRLRW